MFASSSRRLVQACLVKRKIPRQLERVARGVSCRWLSAAAALQTKKIHIHFGTTTGTSQLFANELQSALHEYQEQQSDTDSTTEITVESLQETPTVEALDPQALHLFLVSTAGVGEPPGPARDFFDSLTKTDTAMDEIRFGVFGLGNSAAHPHHYNVAGQTLHEHLVARRAQPWLPLALGDDGDCIEEDYDTWQAAILKKLKAEKDAPNDAGAGNQTEQTSETKLDTEPSTKSTTSAGTSTGTNSLENPPAFGKRLELVPSIATTDEVTRTDILDIMPSYYHAGTKRWKVLGHQSTSPQPTANGLHELKIGLADIGNDSSEKPSYQTGDHLVVYPSQPDYLVEAYLAHWNIPVSEALHSTVEMSAATKQLCEASASSYPHPTGISLYDTLRCCVDLTAPPSPRLARSLLRRDDIDYKAEVFTPRQSPLALLKQSGNTNISLEDLLYQLPAIAPRYYSIASSPLLHPDSLYLTYRPVRFLNSLGNPQQGLCTSYLQQLQVGSNMVAYVNDNPTFRLPEDPQAPVILVAGGCGVAAVRALVEEWSAQGRRNQGSPVYIFLGFRSPSDAAYLDLFESVQPTVLDVAYSVSCSEASQSCGNVTDHLRQHGALLHELLTHKGAYLYACGGARTFGAALQRELYAIYESQGGCTPEEAQSALQKLVNEGRYCEDLAD